MPRPLKTAPRKTAAASTRAASKKRIATKRKPTAAVKSAAAVPAPVDKRLLPAPGTVVVRLYRIGHGDCFLLAFGGDAPATASTAAAKPVYVLIDCGYKPGSPDCLGQPTSAKAITDDLRQATGGRIDLVVVTHPHQDHINGFTADNFEGLSFGACWMAWTEDPGDGVAMAMQARHLQRLVALQGAQQRLGLSLDESARAAARRVQDLLEFELGSAVDAGPGAGAAPLGLGAGALAAAEGVSQNARALALVRERTPPGQLRYIRPHGAALDLPGADWVRVFALGPPLEDDLMRTMDPKGHEGFPAQGFAMAAAATAGLALAEDQPLSPFAARHGVPWGEPVWVTPINVRPGSKSSGWSDYDFAARRYGRGETTGSSRSDEVSGNAAWRRIDDDWLGSAEALALATNAYTNNRSLVLAFELGAGGKVLLFAADAQRGNWVSWARHDSRDRGRPRVTTRDLLARTVLYKVGHHGSHNATLHGGDKDDYANLDWMGQGDAAAEFTAMLTAVPEWAHKKPAPDWNHPLPSIREALLKKSAGRLFQTSIDLAAMAPTAGTTASPDWRAFLARSRGGALFLDLVIER